MTKDLHLSVLQQEVGDSFKGEVLTLYAAYERFLIPSLESKGLRITKVADVNKGRHKYIEASDQRFCFIFKRSMFGTFSKQFDNQKALGESINIDRLWWCIDNKIDYILIGYPDGKIYSIAPKRWKAYSDTNNTYRKVVRKEYDNVFGKQVERIEATASISMSELMRWN